MLLRRILVTIPIFLGSKDLRSLFALDITDLAKIEYTVASTRPEGA